MFDVVFCVDCWIDIYDDRNWCLGYVFMICINCGFCYFIVQLVFYDWVNIGMLVFEMCIVCQQEYNNLFDWCYYF